MRVTLDAMSELGRMSSSPWPVRMRVEKVPSSVMVPSYSPTLTNSPKRMVRVYIRIKPETAWPTTLLAPSEAIRPSSRDRPLKASVCAPGR